MDAIRFDEISRALEVDASIEQCVELVGRLQSRLRNAVVEALTAVRSKVLAERRICPHCSNASVHRHGRDARGRQRFICVGEVGCGRSFGVLQGTVFHRMRKPEVWLPYAERLLRHLPDPDFRGWHRHQPPHGMALEASAASCHGH